MPDLKSNWFWSGAERTWDGLDPEQSFQRAVLIGRELRSRRESQGLSLRDISCFTRIPISSLDAIEKGELHRLPGNDGNYWSLNLYVKSFIRTYAEYLDFKEDPLSLYSAAAAPAIAVPTNAPPTKVSAAKQPLPPRPPKFAEYLLYLFLTKSERVHLVGDLTEEYADVIEKFGPKKANVWCYTQVYQSLKPLIWRSLSKLRLLASLLQLLSRLRNYW